MSDSEPPESSGNYIANVSYDVQRKPAAKIVCLGVSQIAGSGRIIYFRHHVLRHLQIDLAKP